MCVHPIIMHPYLKEGDGKLWVHFSGDPNPARVMNVLCLGQSVLELTHEFQPKVTILQQ